MASSRFWGASKALVQKFWPVGAVGVAGVAAAHKLPRSTANPLWQTGYPHPDIGVVSPSSSKGLVAAAKATVAEKEADEKGGDELLPPRDLSSEVIKILVADPVSLGGGDEALEYMRRKGWHVYDGPVPSGVGPGIHVSYQPSISVEEIAAQTSKGQYDSAIVAAKVLPKEVLLAEGAVRMGAGVNNMQYTGGPVMNTPGQNSETTAEMVLHALLDSRLDLGKAHEEVRVGTAESLDLTDYYKSGIKGQRIAIIGAGNIGQEVIKRAKASGMEVVVCSRSMTPEQAAIMGVEYAETPAEAATGADVLSVHTALTKETEGSINTAVLDALKPGATIVNAARGPVIDIEAAKAHAAKDSRAVFIVDADMYKGKAGPLDPYREAEERFPGQFKLTQHLFADCDHPSRVEAACRAADGLEALLLRREVQNYAGNMIGRGSIPDGYTDGGTVKPAIGYYTPQEAVAALQTGMPMEHLMAALAIGKRCAEGGPCTKEDAARYAQLVEASRLSERTERAV